MNLFPKVKFCGLSNYDDVALACEQQAYWAGFIFVKGSSRYIKIEESKSIISLFKNKIKFVGVFVNPSNDHIKRAIKAELIISSCMDKKRLKDAKKLKIFLIYL